MQPFFLGGAQGRLFGVYLPPDPAVPARGGILYAPPFAEEMNKSRRMAALAARAFAADGWGVLQLDLFGTGDSEGDFSEARWPGWLADLGIGAAWLAARTPGAPLLWGLRLGALLALDTARSAVANPRGLLLWQPLVSGEVALTQFLRLRLAATLRESEKETPATLRKRLATGDALEIAGYELHPELAAALDVARAEVPAPAIPVGWFEVAAEAGRAPGPASRRTLDAWIAAGCRPHEQIVAGDAFWGTQEIVEVPALVDASVAWLRGLPA